jgi:hypothetical protein
MLLAAGCARRELASACRAASNRKFRSLLLFQSDPEATLHERFPNSRALVLAFRSVDFRFLGCLVFCAFAKAPAWIQMQLFYHIQDVLFRGMPL